MDNEIRKTGSDLTTSDLAASVQKRPEPAVPDSQLPKTQPGDNRSSQYGTATAPAREEVTPLFAPDEPDRVQVMILIFLAPLVTPLMSSEISLLRSFQAP